MIDEWSDRIWGCEWWNGVNRKWMRTDGWWKAVWSESDAWVWIVNKRMDGIVHTSTITNTMIKKVYEVNDDME